VSSPDIRRESPVDVAQPEAEDVRLWGVTTVLGVLDKPGLMWWAAGMTADAAIAIAQTLPKRVEEEGRDAVWDWLRRAQFRKARGKRSATELGSLVHAACEDYAITGERPPVEPDVAPFVDQFERWCDLWQPEYQAAEMTVYSPKWGYAGTCDAFLTINGMPVIADYKTTAKADEPDKPAGPYPEVALQLAAYRFAECAAVWRPRRHELFRRRYYLLGADEREMSVPVPAVDGGLVIHITPEHCHAYPVRCDEAVFDAFLYVLETARWHLETSKTAIGERLVHPSEGAIAA